MRTFLVQYELDVKPTPVTILIKCGSEDDAKEEYQKRTDNLNCKNLQIIQEDIEDKKNI